MQERTKQQLLVIGIALMIASAIWSVKQDAYATSYSSVAPNNLTGKHICGVARIGDVVGIESPDDNTFYQYNASTYAIIASTTMGTMGCANILTYAGSFIFVGDVGQGNGGGIGLYNIVAGQALPFNTINPCSPDHIPRSSQINFAIGTPDNAREIDVICQTAGHIASVSANTFNIRSSLTGLSSVCNVMAWVHDVTNGYGYLACSGSIASSYKMVLISNAVSSSAWTYLSNKGLGGAITGFVGATSANGRYYVGDDAESVKVVNRTGNTISINSTLLSGTTSYPFMCLGSQTHISAPCITNLVLDTSLDGHQFEGFYTANNSMAVHINCGNDCPQLSFLGGSTVSNDTFYSTSGALGSFIIFHGSPYTGSGNGTCNTGACQSGGSGGSGGSSNTPPTPSPSTNPNCITQSQFNPVTNTGTLLNTFENWWFSLNIASCNDQNPQTNGFGLVVMFALLVLEVVFFMLVTKGQLEKIHVAFWVVGLMIAILIPTYFGLVPPYWFVLLVVVLILFSSYRIWSPALLNKSTSVGIGGD